MFKIRIRVLIPVFIIGPFRFKGQSEKMNSAAIYLMAAFLDYMIKWKENDCLERR